MPIIEQFQVSLFLAQRYRREENNRDDYFQLIVTFQQSYSSTPTHTHRHRGISTTVTKIKTSMHVKEISKGNLDPLLKGRRQKK